ncbi:MAG: phosphate-starvation-inducible PsiE family protein [Solirubrobacteraceae bacterium]
MSDPGRPTSLPAEKNALERFNAMLRERLMGKAPHLGVIRIGEDIIHYVVALVLVVAAVLVLANTAYELFTARLPYYDAATTAVNGVLFAIIVLEVMRTVVAHFEHGGLQLQPFLIIGIISAVREILSVGARLSLQNAGGEPPPATVHLALLELGVNAAVVVGLAFALVLIRRVARMTDDGLGD